MRRTKSLYQLSTRIERSKLRQMEFVDRFTAKEDENQKVTPITAERFRTGDMLWVVDDGKGRRFVLGSVGRKR